MPAAATTYTAVYREVTAANGLSGVYFDNADLTGPSVTRRDAAVNFNWAAGSPTSQLAPDTFSARWTGQIRADRSELYTFHVTADDGVRLWVNDRLVVDRWSPHSVTEFSGSIPMTAGQKVSLRLEYFEQTGQAVCALRWSSPSTPKAVIPSTNLFTTTTLPAANYLSADVGGVAPAGSTTQVTLGRAYDVSGGGADVGATADRFRFVHRLVHGDFDLAARVDSLSALDDAAKGGLMVRDGLAAGARNVFAGLTRLGQTFASYRTATNAATARVTSTTQAPPNSWLRLRRTGDTFTTFRSTNGTTWTQINQVTIDLPDVVNVGLAVTSGNATRLATFRFRDMN
jgi:regulation of enolase protein 1 (concanavalin A-like superfamily)